MTSERLSLLQHWMKTVVTERGVLEQKLRAAAARHGLSADDVVAEKRGLSARERLDIYARGYLLRLLECMRADFPVLRGLFGEEVFDAFARAYIITRPPDSPSLYDLGADFPRFLEETRPKNSPPEAWLDQMLELPPELARLERARAEVTRARGTEEDDPSSALAPAPPEIFGGELTLQATPCLRLLELKFPLVEYLRSADRGERPEPPAPRASFAAIGRTNYRVCMEEAAPWQFAFLKACASPSPLYTAARAAALESGEEEACVLARLTVWLPVAFELGFLRRVS
jgi:Putative DNA-binding domain